MYSPSNFFTLNLSKLKLLRFFRIQCIHSLMPRGFSNVPELIRKIYFLLEDPKYYLNIADYMALFPWNSVNLNQSSPAESQ